MNAGLAAPAGSNMNIAERLRAMAGAFPDKPAVVFPTGRSARGKVVYGQMSYRELDEQSDAYARGLARNGFGKGTKTVLMVDWSPEMFTIVYALMKLGAIPVFVDPGMGISRMLHCYRLSKAEAFIGIPLGHVFRVANPKTFGGLRKVVTVGRRWFWGGPSLDELAIRSSEPFPIANVSAADVFIVLFTTGSTEAARAVGITFGKLAGLYSAVRELLDLGSDDVTMSTVPAIGLFDVLFGATVVLPPMSPVRLASADPRKLSDAITRFGVTKMMVSPTLLVRLGDYVAARGVRFPSVRKVVMIGALATQKLVERFRAALPDASRLEVAYGSTEASVMATLEFAELEETDALTATGKGGCVGRPGFGCELRIVRISDDAIPTWSDEWLAGPGEVGEIVVAGPLVTGTYYDAPDVDARTKIADGRRLWHRTGDLGTIDEKGRLWIAGRKTNRIFTASGPLFPEQWEGVFNAHPDVQRTALVGIGAPPAQRPVVCVELKRTATEHERRRIEGELRRLARRFPLTATADTFLFHPSFPVDARHNAKVNRKELALWAERELAGAPRALRARVAALLPRLARGRYARKGIET